MTNEKKTQQQLRVEAAERRKKVLTRLKAGLSNVAIAADLGVSEKTIRNDIKAVLKQLQTEQIEEVGPLRSLWGARLNQLLQVNWPDAVKRVPRAEEMVFRILEKQGRLFGLAAAVKIDLQVEQELTASLQKLEKGLSSDEFAKVIQILALADDETGENESD